MNPTIPASADSALPRTPKTPHNAATFSISFRSMPSLNTLVAIQTNVPIPTSDIAMFPRPLTTFLTGIFAAISASKDTAVPATPKAPHNKARLEMFFKFTSSLNTSFATHINAPIADSDRDIFVNPFTTLFIGISLTVRANRDSAVPTAPNANKIKDDCTINFKLESLARSYRIGITIRAISVNPPTTIARLVIPFSTVDIFTLANPSNKLIIPLFGSPTRPPPAPDFPRPLKNLTALNAKNAVTKAPTTGSNQLILSFSQPIALLIPLIIS